MKKTSKKILGRSIAVLSAVTVAGMTSFFLMKRSQNNIVTTMGSISENTPVIVLDAGHGECT